MMLLVIQYQKGCERTAVLVCAAVWRPAHLPACSERVKWHTGTPKGRLEFWGEGAYLLGLVVHVPVTDTVQSSIKPHLPPSFWEDAELGRCLVFLLVRQNTKPCQESTECFLLWVQGSGSKLSCILPGCKEFQVVLSCLGKLICCKNLAQNRQ